MTKALPKLALSACNNLQGSSGLRLLVLYMVIIYLKQQQLQRPMEQSLVQMDVNFDTIRDTYP